MIYCFGGKEGVVNFFFFVIVIGVCALEVHWGERFSLEFSWSVGFWEIFHFSFADGNFIVHSFRGFGGKIFICYVVVYNEKSTKRLAFGMNFRPMLSFSWPE